MWLENTRKYGMKKMSAIEPEEEYAVSEFVEKLREDLGTSPSDQTDLLYQNIGNGDIVAYDLDDNLVWIERNGKRRTQKGERIRFFGNRNLMEVVASDNIFVYDKVGEPENKYELISHDETYELTDIVVDTMNSEEGFPGFDVGVDND